MSDNLDTLSDQQLGELFAVEVAGLRYDKTWGRVGWYDRHETRCFGGDAPSYCRDANTVLPWLEKWLYVDINRDDDFAVGPWAVAISRERKYTPLFNGHGKSFARAAVLALIRAKRAENAAISTG